MHSYKNNSTTIFTEDCVEFDTSFHGSDINNYESHKQYAKGCGMRDSAKDCQLLCASVHNCDVFTYEVSTKYCFLKKYEGFERISVPGLISGIKFCNYHKGPNSEKIGHGTVYI